MDAKTVNNSTTPRARKVKRAVMGVLLAVAGTVAVSAWAQSHGHGGGFGPGLFGRGEFSERAVDHVLDGVNATDAQRTQIKAIVQAAAADLKAQRAAGKALHEEGLKLFTAPVVDARAVETLRQQTLAQFDQSSKRISQALLDVSAVLTPEQRVKLAERFKKMADRAHERQRVAPDQPNS